MIEVRLQCEHRLNWRTLSHAPKPRERVWCQECKDMSAVVSRTGEWTAQCSCKRWQRTYVTLEKLRDRVTEHIQQCGNPVTIQNHDATETVTVRTPRAARHAADHGNHSASVAATRRVLPPSDTPGTLF